MKITLINKSDLRGGAAVVTYRLMHALRQAGVDARMLVVEKLSDDPYVTLAAPHWRARIPFLKERLRIFAANGFNRDTLFKIDTADSGLPLWRHPLVRDADAVLLNWVNQGMLSLRGVQRIADMGKKILWTMHDMWCMTGICHHAGDCPGYQQQCGDCPLLRRGDRALGAGASRSGSSSKGITPSAHDLSHTVWQHKQQLYTHTNIHFVAVSNWLADRCRQSGLLGSQQVSVIPNAFPIPPEMPRTASNDRYSIVMGAARLDDSIKGFDIAIEALRLFAQRHPVLARRTVLNTFGTFRDPSLLQQVPIRNIHHGVISEPEALNRLYAANHIVLSTSRYETLPGTLIEGQAMGCLPVAFDRGGQRDIIDTGLGCLVDYGPDDHSAASNMADALTQAITQIQTADSVVLLHNLRQSVQQKFSAQAVAQRYIELLEA